MDVFADRAAAGRALAPLIAARLEPGERATVLGLPRGGVPVAAEVARALQLPLDVLLVRKLGVPGHEELAFGALAAGGVRVLNADVVELAELDDEAMDAVVARERTELARREQRYRPGRPPLDLAGRTAIVVDDGLATGATMRAAVRAVAELGATRTIAAAPVGSPTACSALAQAAADVVCARAPHGFRAVGAWYADFSEVSDAEVTEALDHALSREGRDSSAAAGAPTPRA
jgi:predicted phosphoribosyltransferase